MNLHEDYLDRVKSLVGSLGTVLSEDERAEVEHLINHNECGDALRTLAWIIVEERKCVSCKVVADILELADGLVLKQHFPQNLERYREDF